MPLSTVSKPGAGTPANTRRLSFAYNYVVVLASFCLFTLISWPILLSFDLWIFEDRNSFLHLDELLTKHHQLGVDIFYSYGLLPVFLQHLLFLVFGRSFKPMIGCTLVVLALNALFWAALLERLPPQRRWLASVALLSPIVLVVNPNWPYSLAVLSIMFALIFVLESRLDIAHAISAIGCFCVPSLTLLLFVLIGFTIAGGWVRSPARRARHLAAMLAPGVLTYAGLAVALACIFGYAPLAATAIPLNGSRFYKEAGYSGLGAFLTFFHPAGYGTKYYIAYYAASPVTWFVLCSLFLFAYTAACLPSLIKRIPLAPPATFVVLYSVLQFAFVFFIYGARGQHVLYEGLIAAATLVGISNLPRSRTLALALFVVVGVAGETGTVYKAVAAWRTTAPSPVTFGLYADPGLARELAEIVEESRSRKTLVLGYATGIHNYYPTLEDPEAWVMQRGQLFPEQKKAITAQIEQADAVVEVLASQSPAVNSDPQFQAALNAMQLDRPRTYFRVRTRRMAIATAPTFPQPSAPVGSIHSNSSH